MIRRQETDPADRDEQLGEAIEAYLALAESGSAPDPEAFAAGYPDLTDDLRAALEGLALVRGLVGDSSGPGHHRLEAGQRVAGYRIVRELGRGGMGIVYEAVHVDLDRPVALKVLGTHAAPDSTGRRRFLNEAKTAAGLHHTHIVPVFDVGQVGGLCYYAMQRIEGSGLDRVIRALRRDRSTAAGSTSRREPITPPEAAPGAEGSPSSSSPGTGLETATWLGEAKAGGRIGRSGRDRDRDRGPGVAHEPPPFEPPRGSAYYSWVAEVGRRAAEALAHAHGRGVIHRDVKPSNLLIDARGSIWVADFGLARRLADPGLTQSDSLLGTPRYMSPEQIDGLPTDGRTDVYGLGATFYELLTLRPAFDGRTAVELHRQITGREPVSPRHLDPKIPRDLETIALKAMAKRPADRYESAIALAEDLGRFLRHEPVRARRIGPAGRLWRLARRHPSVTAVSTAAVAAILAVATVAYVRVIQERDDAVRAEEKARHALIATQEAERGMRQAMQRQLSSQASATLLSTLPDRRAQGLSLLKRAAGIGPDASQTPELTQELRDKALEFLSLYEVERTGLVLSTGASLGLTYGPAGERLAVLSDGGTLDLWGIDPRHEPERLAAPIETGLSRSNLFSRRGLSSNLSGLPNLVAIDPFLAITRPNGRGFRLIDAFNPDRVADTPLPGRNVVGLFAGRENPTRLVTFELKVEPRPEAERGASRRDDRATVLVNLWDLDRADEPIRTLIEVESANGPGRGRMNPLAAMAPDGRTIATARPTDPEGSTWEIAIWSAGDGGLLRTIKPQVPPTVLALGPDGLLAAACGGAIRLWDVAAERPLPGLTPNMNHVRLLRFSPDGALLAVVGGDFNFGAETFVELWDPTGNTPVATLRTPDRFHDLAFAPSGERRLAIGQGDSIATWSVHEPIGMLRFSGFGRAPSSLAFGPGGMLVMSARDESPRIWCPRAGPSASQPLAGIEPNALRFDDRGRLVVVEPEAVRWFRPAEGTVEDALSLPEPRSSFGGGFGPGPGSGPGPRSGPGSGSGSGSGPSSRRGGPSRRDWDVRAAGFDLSADGRTLVLAQSTDVLIWSADDPASPRFLDTHLAARPDATPGRDDPFSRFWRMAALSPSGDRVYLLNLGGELSAWSTEGAASGPIAWTAAPPPASCLAVSPDGATLALGDREAGGVVLIDAHRGATRARLDPSPGDDGEADDATVLAFSPDGRMLAVGTKRGGARLWKLGPRPEPLVRLPGHRGAIESLAFDAEGRRVASGGHDQTVVVWDLDRARQELRTLGLDW